MKKTVWRIWNYLRKVGRRRRKPADMPPAWVQASAARDDRQDRYAEMQRIVAVTMLLG